MSGGTRFRSRRQWSRRRHEGAARKGGDGGGVHRVMKPAGVEADGVGVAAEGASDRPVGHDLTSEGPAVVDAERAAVEHRPPKGPPPVAGDEAAGEDLPSVGPPLVAADGADGEDLPQEVAARLKEVLANIDPIYHGVFVDMYKKFHS